MKQRRMHPRRLKDNRIHDLLSGECDNPIWTISGDGVTQQVVHCGACLPCRIKQRLGDRMMLEIIRDLDAFKERRTLASRRRGFLPVRADRRRSAGRRPNE